ncbi:MAG: hypothetical protein ACEY3E_03175 [Candidatus Tisiphia sp.]|jgi:hypothetical protein|nr:hypothetical protein [Rickettsiaceae bacterium]UCM92773.1 MAG: hypothetical protein LF884_00290 [Rickettsia endosymbiont of Cimex lectularius]
MSISLNETLYDKLKYMIPSKKISNFVSNAIAKELEKKELELTLAYKDAEQDNERQNLLKEWDAIDDISKK